MRSDLQILVQQQFYKVRYDKMQVIQNSSNFFEVIKAFNEAKEAQVADVTVYDAFINAACRADEFRHARQAVREVKDLGTITRKKWAYLSGYVENQLSLNSMTRDVVPKPSFFKARGDSKSKSNASSVASAPTDAAKKTPEKCSFYPTALAKACAPRALT